MSYGSQSTPLGLSTGISQLNSVATTAGASGLSASMGAAIVGASAFTSTSEDVSVQRVREIEYEYAQRVATLRANYDQRLEKIATVCLPITITN